MNRITYDDDGNPIVRPREIIPERHWPGNLTGIFNIDGSSYDVSLEELKLSWSPLTGTGKGPKNRPKSKKKDKNKDKEEFDGNCIKIEDILGVRLRRLKRSGQKEGEGVCQGFSVFTYHKKSSTKWRDWTLNVGHPSEEICAEWINRIQSLVKQFDHRPKKLKVFLQPHAGKKIGRSIFNEKVLPLFQAGSIEFDVVDCSSPEQSKSKAEDGDDVNHNEHIKQEMVHLTLSNYDSIVCVGGDGTVSRIMNGILTKTQHDNDIDIRPHFGPAKATIPVGIIPTGITNQIAHTVMGIEDPTTAAIHIMLGHTHPLDVMSVYKDDKFYQWSLNGHYGYFGNVLPFLSRYAMLGEKKLNASFAKALTSSKFRSYECDISYIPSAVAGSSDPSDGHACRQGCGVCSLDPNSTDQGLVYEDKVMSLDPLNESGNSSVLEVADEDNPWNTVKGDFLSLSVLSEPGLSDICPLGVGPYTHLADGTMDLILVHATDRKEFVRYLKRHGNEKNQLSFPFVQSHRCREVRFHARSQQTWNFKDLSKNDAVEASKEREFVITQRAKKTPVDEVLVIDQLSSSSDEEDDKTLSNKTPHGGSIVSGVGSITSSAKGKRKDSNCGYTNEVLSLQDESDGAIVEEDDEEATIFEEPGNESSNKSKTQKETKEDQKRKRKEEKKQREKEKKEKKEKEKKEKERKKKKQAKDKDKDMNNKNKKANDSEGDDEFEDEDDELSDEDSSRAGSAEGRMQEGTNTMMYVSDNYRVTLPEKERMRRAKSRQKKSEKKQLKAETRGKALWNLDNELEIEQDLLFRIHQGLVLVHGLGVPRDYDPDDVKFGCLGVF